MEEGGFEDAKMLEEVDIHFDQVETRFRPSKFHKFQGIPLR